MIVGIETASVPFARKLACTSVSELVGVCAGPQGDVEPVESERVAEEAAGAGEAVEDSVFDEVVDRDVRRHGEQARAAGVGILEADPGARLAREVGRPAAVLEERGVDDRERRVV